MSNDRFAIANLTGGQLNAIVKKFGGEAGAHEFLAGRKVARTVDLRVDLGAAPFVPPGLQLKQHAGEGITLDIVPSKIVRLLTDGQWGSGGERGAHLRSAFYAYFGTGSQLMLNANVLDALLADTALIPPYLKPENPAESNLTHLVFWGTVYEERGRECVRALVFNAHLGAWIGKIVYTDMLFHEWAPAAFYQKAA